MRFSMCVTLDSSVAVESVAARSSLVLYQGPNVLVMSDFSVNEPTMLDFEMQSEGRLRLLLRTRGRTAVESMTSRELANWKIRDNALVGSCADGVTATLVGQEEFEPRTTIPPDAEILNPEPTTEEPTTEEPTTEEPTTEEPTTEELTTEEPATEEPTTEELTTEEPTLSPPQPAPRPRGRPRGRR